MATTKQAKATEKTEDKTEVSEAELKKNQDVSETPAAAEQKNPTPTELANAAKDAVLDQKTDDEGVDVLDRVSEFGSEGRMPEDEGRIGKMTFNGKRDQQAQVSRDSYADGRVKVKTF